MNVKAPIFVVSLLVLMSLACDNRAHDGRTRAQSERPEQEDRPPLLEIEITPTRKLDKPLEFQWKITNRSEKPVYFYSTLLQKPNTYFAEIDIDGERKMIEVRFTSLEPVEVAPNYFPKTEFTRVDVGQSQDGSFVSHDPIERLASYSAIGKKTEVQKITAGAWTIRSLLAYGYEVESVKDAAAKSVSHGTEHPINPVVQWQKVVYSNLINVTFQQ